MKFLKVSVLCGMILVGICACGNTDESKQEAETVKTEEQSAEIEKEPEVIEEEPEESFDISGWIQDPNGIDEDFGMDMYYMEITDSIKDNSVIIYDTGESYQCTVLENGSGRLNTKASRTQAMPNDDYKVVGKYILDNANTKDVSVTDFSSEKYDYDNTSSYYINATLATPNKEDSFLVAYKIYSEVTDYSQSRIGLMMNGEMYVSDSLDRVSSVNEKFDIKILGCIDFESYDNAKAFYNDTNFDIDYDVRGQFDDEQSYRQFSGSTPFSLDDNTMVGIVRVQENCSSELGSSNDCKIVPVANGEGIISTFLEIPGDQAEDPTYQFIIDGIVPFEIIEN